MQHDRKSQIPPGGFGAQEALDGQNSVVIHLGPRFGIFLRRFGIEHNIRRLGNLEIDARVRSRPPPGQVSQVLDSSGGQLNAKSTAADVAKIDFAKVNPVTGPIYIDDAEPGDAVKVTILELSPSGWGWWSS